MVYKIIFMKKTSKGFTLVELLVVIGVIALAFRMTLGSYTASLRSARDNKRKTDLEVIRQGLELYRSDNTTTGYPNAVGNALTVLASPLSSPNTYINPANFPKDPQNNLNYFYYYQRTAANTYRICAYVESPKAGDPACPNAAVNCKTGGPACNYGLTQP